MGIFKRASIMIGIYLGIALPYQLRGNHAVRPYVEQNIQRLIGQQNENLGIRHFGMPKIVYSKGLKALTNFSVKGIAYDSGSGSIKLSTGFMTTPEFNLENIVARIINLGDAWNVDSTLNHELGHVYESGMLLHLKKENPNPLDVSTNREVEAFVSEGIAEYFGRRMTGRKVASIYNRQYFFVKPVLDVSVEKGVMYLLAHPPSSTADDSLYVYRAHALAALSGDIKIKSIKK